MAAERAAHARRGGADTGGPDRGPDRGNEPRDGRAARSQRTREAVVQALLDLLRAGNLRPTAREIAERAGVSLRSVYTHFDDVEDLFCAAATEEVASLAAILRLVPSDGPLDARMDAFIAQRARIWEALGPVGRAAALQEPFSRSLSRMLASGRARARAEIERVFAAELAGRADAVEAVDLIASESAWQQLRTHQGLDVTAASAVLRGALEPLLEAGSGGHQRRGGQ